MSDPSGRRRFLFTAGATMAGCVSACADGSPARVVKECGTTTNGPGLGYCLIQRREIRVVGAARLQVHQAMLTGIDDQTATIVARDEGGFYALSAMCPHACCLVVLCNDVTCSDPKTSPEGCAPPVASALSQGGALAFFCPCHGSEFAADGTVLFGPATTSLPSVQLRIEGDDVLVDLSRPAPASQRL